MSSGDGSSCDVGFSLTGADSKAGPTSERTATTALRDLQCFRWDQLTGESDLSPLFNYRSLWSKLQAIDQVLNNQSESSKLPAEALNWSKWIKADEGSFIGGGSFGDVFKGIWLNLPYDIGSMPQIVVKFMRLSPLDVKQTAKRDKMIQREIIVWNTARHKNIVPFIGICYARGPDCPGLISPWMENRGIMMYLRLHPNIERETMLLGIASGLEFLHGHEIIHGDVKSANILVNKHGEPCLIDFGISRMISDQTLWHTSSTHAPGSLRWQAPELMDGTEPAVTYKGDVYSFGMTSLEVITDSVPFNEYPRELTIYDVVVHQQRMPRKPSNIKIKWYLWNMWNCCWLRASHERPTMTNIVRELLVADFLSNLQYSSLANIGGFRILFLLNAGVPEAALKIIGSDNGQKRNVPMEILDAWCELPTNVLAQLVTNQCRAMYPIHTPLLHAAERGLERELLEILDSTAARNGAIRDYEAALILSSQNGHSNLVRHLLRHAARPDSINSAWEDTIATAVRCGYSTDTVKILLEHCSSTARKSMVCTDAMFNALGKGQIDLATLLLDYGADIMAKDKEGRLLLHLVASSGHVEMAKLLLERGINVSVVVEDGSTALHVAARNGHVNMAKLLLEHGIHIEAKNENGVTALHDATAYGHVNVASLLLERGADIEAKNVHGWTAAGWSAQSGSPARLTPNVSNMTVQQIREHAMRETLTIIKGNSPNSSLSFVKKLGETGMAQERSGNDKQALCQYSMVAALLRHVINQSEFKSNQKELLPIFEAVYKWTEPNIIPRFRKLEERLRRIEDEQRMEAEKAALNSLPSVDDRIRSLKDNGLGVMTRPNNAVKLRRNTGGGAVGRQPPPPRTMATNMNHHRQATIPSIIRAPSPKFEDSSLTGGIINGEWEIDPADVWDMQRLGKNVLFLDLRQSLNGDENQPEECKGELVRLDLGVWSGREELTADRLTSVVSLRSKNERLLYQNRRSFALIVMIANEDDERLCREVKKALWDMEFRNEWKSKREPVVMRGGWKAWNALASSRVSKQATGVENQDLGLLNIMSSKGN